MKADKGRSYDTIDTYDGHSMETIGRLPAPMGGAETVRI